MFVYCEIRVFFSRFRIFLNCYKNTVDIRLEMWYDMYEPWLPLDILSLWLITLYHIWELLALFFCVFYFILTHQIL